MKIYIRSKKTNHNKLNQFVFVSTIEPRKNHAFLLNIWKDIINQIHDPTKIPKLIFFGRHGWGTENVKLALKINPALNKYVTHIENADDETIIQQILLAKATLFPSFDEGWGLPIVESLSLGTAVICSNLPVHAECSLGQAIMIDLLDGLKWRDTIIKISQQDKPLINDEFMPTTWAKSVNSFRQILNQTEKIRDKRKELQDA